MRRALIGKALAVSLAWARLLNADPHASGAARRSDRCDDSGRHVVAAVGTVHPKSKCVPSRIANALSRASFMSARARASLTRADSACTRLPWSAIFLQFCTSRACSISLWLMSGTLRPDLGRVDGVLDVCPSEVH